MPRVSTAHALRLVLLTVLAFSVLSNLERRAFAAETADEADVEFQLGNDRYDAGDFKAALSHFLASNRLAPNRNVLVNIGRAYEQLKLIPEAYGYYSLALEGETDALRRQRIEESRARLQSRVARLTVETDPPGAVIYLDRKDLGSRGVAPQTLALAEGEHTVLVELPDFEPAQSEKVAVDVGDETVVKIKLKPILGKVTVRGTEGSDIHLDIEAGPAACRVPCTINARPGRHVVLVSKGGFKSAEVPVDVIANQSSPARADLQTLSGSLVVNSDVREALVSIDGQPRAFTPAVVEVPVGVHEVLVSQSGFRPVKRKVVVQTDQSVKLDFELSGQEEVLGASRTAEAVEDAPASVTIISREELRAMGYPTIAEAIRGVRGVYLSYDDSYNSTGVRGFSRPGDYGNRILVLVDGHPTNDNWIWTSYVGFDARVDIDDVERIEVIRGAGSVAYGTSAFFGVINLITRSNQGPSHVEAAVSTAQGVGRARATAFWHPAQDAGVWVSFAGAQSGGIDRYYPEYVSTPNANNQPSIIDYQGNPATGLVRDADGMRAGTIGGHAWYQALSARWLLTSQKKHQPSAPYGTEFGSPDTTNTDTRSFVDVQLEPKWENIESLTRAHFDTYYFYDNLTYAPNSADPNSYGIENDEYTGVWGGIEERLTVKLPPSVKFTVGGDLTRHFTTHQRNVDDRGRAGYVGPQAGPIIDNNNPFTNAAGYGQLDLAISPRVRVSAAARVDYFDNLKFDFGASFSPRLALIIKPYDRGNLKLMAGKAFRVPSIYERYYVGTTQIAGAALVPEQVLSGEAEFTHRFSNAITGLVTAYTNYVSNLIELDAVYNRGESVNQYRNSDAPVLVLGAESEVRHEWRQGYMLSASFSVQKARYQRDSNLREVPNSPLVLAAVKGALPIIGRTLMLASRLSIDSPRYDDQFRKVDVSCDPGGAVAAPCPSQGTTKTGVIWDLVFSGGVPQFNARYAFGLYNVMDWQYDTVPSTEFSQRTIRQRPRSVLASLALDF